MLLSIFSGGRWMGQHLAAPGGLDGDNDDIPECSEYGS